MILKLLAPFVPGLLILVGSIPIFVLGYLRDRIIKRQPRQSPLTRDLLRPAGHSLTVKIESINFDVGTHLAAVAAMPLLAFSIHVGLSHYSRLEQGLISVVATIVAVIAVMVGGSRKILALMDERQWMRLGLEGEQATAEELNLLMLEGCRVFHDIPADYGNIDHVVISRSGVFSINTKMLGKPKGKGNDNKIVVDNQQGVIKFPDRTYRIPVKQLETEANWLSKFLSSAVGQSIEAEPMLALPGWYIEQRIGRGSVFVLNPINAARFFVHKRDKNSPELIQRIAHQLDGLCRNVERSYREELSWEKQK